MNVKDYLATLQPSYRQRARERARRDARRRQADEAAAYYAPICATCQHQHDGRPCHCGCATFVNDVEI